MQSYPKDLNWSVLNLILLVVTVEVLVSGRLPDAEKVSVTGAGRLQQRFSYAATRDVKYRWPLTAACPVNIEDAKTFHRIKLFLFLLLFCYCLMQCRDNGDNCNECTVKSL